MTFVYCGQTIGWIRMPLEVGLGPGHIVLDGDPDLPTERDTSAAPLFGTFLAWSPISANTELLFYIYEEKPTD